VWLVNFRKYDFIHCIDFHIFNHAIFLLKTIKLLKKHVIVFLVNLRTLSILVLQRSFNLQITLNINTNKIIKSPQKYKMFENH
jgi:hypothetical protein